MDLRAPERYGSLARNEEGVSMMRQILIAATAALALAACNQQGAASGPAMPTLEAGAQAPSVQTPPVGPVEQVRITDENRRQVEANVTDLLNQLGESVARGATPPTGYQDTIVALQPGTDARYTIALAAGTQYSFVGACDIDCSNVDIELIDMRTGGVVGSDLLQDDYPVVHFRPDANGDYMVRLLMQTCTRAPCYAGARTLQHPAQ